MNVAIVPARGGSKRLPRKNILPLAGQPLLARVVTVLHASGLFDRVLVSTEDQEIAAVASAAGADVLVRDGSLATDRATVAQVCLDVVSKYADIEQFCCLYPTAVLVRPETLQASFVQFQQSPMTDYLMGVSEYVHPPMQALVTNQAGFLEYLWPEYRGVQSQFFPATVVSNGTFYWARVAAFLRDKTFYGQRLQGFVVPESEVCDLNTPADFVQLQARFQALYPVVA